jgi:TolB-like protein
MKNYLIIMFLLLFVALGLNAQQQLTVAVSPFEVRGEFSKDNAEVITELFTSELVAENQLKVVDRNNFDKIITEMRFQASDWSNSDKVAQLGKALNANSIVRGTIMLLAGQIVITANILDINTAQILSSSTLQMRNVDEIFSKLPEFVKELAKNLPKALEPNYFIGTWKSTTKYSYGYNLNREAILTCILQFMEDGNIVVSKYESAKVEGSQTRQILDIGWNQTEKVTATYNGTGNGKYSFKKRTNDDRWDLTISLRLNEGVETFVDTNLKIYWNGLKDKFSTDDKEGLIAQTYWFKNTNWGGRRYFSVFEKVR